MPLQKIVPTAGVNVQYTPTLAEGTWAASNLIRFKDGMAQKRGGWNKWIQESLFHCWNLPEADFPDKKQVQHMSFKPQKTENIL